MTAPDVRPARARDLPLLTGLTGDVGADEMVLVVNDPPVGFARVAFPDGQAHLAQLAVWGEQDDALVGHALVEAVCEQLAVRGHGQVTTLLETGMARTGFEPFTTDEPRASHQLALEAEGEAIRQILARRTLRRHRTAEELPRSCRPSTLRPRTRARSASSYGDRRSGSARCSSTVSSTRRSGSSATAGTRAAAAVRPTGRRTRTCSST